MKFIIKFISAPHPLSKNGLSTKIAGELAATSFDPLARCGESEIHECFRPDRPFRQVAKSWHHPCQYEDLYMQSVERTMYQVAKYTTLKSCTEMRWCIPAFYHKYARVPPKQPWSTIKKLWEARTTVGKHVWRSLWMSPNTLNGLFVWMTWLEDCLWIWEYSRQHGFTRPWLFLAW